MVIGDTTDRVVRPTESTFFTEICGKFVTSQRADVGIGPYTFPEGF